MIAPYGSVRRLGLGMKMHFWGMSPSWRFVGCLFLIFQAAFSNESQCWAAKQDEILFDRPDSHTAGLLNTEIAPEGAFQADLVTGHLWYGASSTKNIMTHVFTDALLLGGIPSMSLGGKSRYCESYQFSCSLLIELSAGYKLTHQKKKYFAGFFQHTIAYDFDSMGRLTWGIGAGLFSSRTAELQFDGFEDHLGAWTNLFFDYPLASDWSVGIGGTPLLGSRRQYNTADGLFSDRLGLAAGSLVFLRSQHSFDHWQLTGGGALVSWEGRVSLWPVVEVIWRQFDLSSAELKDPK